MEKSMTDQQRSINTCKYGTGFFGGKFLPFHRGHLDCILRCASECEKLFVLLMYNGEEELQILEDYQGAFPAEHLSPHTRELALRAELAPFGNIEVVAYDCREADARAVREGKHPWFYECRDLIGLLGRFDVAYSSEPAYAETFRAFYPWADAVVLDERRARNPISATEIRSMPFYAAYDFLPREYQKLVNKKVLFTGTESCGKSTLVRKLAAVLNTSFTEEQGKLACERVGLPSPGAQMYPQFIHAQVMADAEAVRTANKVAICDTDAIVTEFYLNVLEDGGGLLSGDGGGLLARGEGGLLSGDRGDLLSGGRGGLPSEGAAAMPLAQETARLNLWDAVFFVEPAVPWVADGLRTSSDQQDREAQARMLKDAYARLGYELIVLDGGYRQNYEQALFKIESLLGYHGESEEEVQRYGLQ